TGLGQREARERFQRSPETVSHVFNHVLDMLVSPRFYRRYIKLPRHDDIPPEVQKNPRFYPYFESVRGAIDCTHI
ncbi:hypothetical protein K466DRAFT_459926, partial [Polyporus arcularius HHB13444]